MKSLFLVFFCVAAASAKFDFGGLVSNLVNSGPLAAFKNEIDGATKIAQLIKDHQANPQSIVQAIVSMGLDQDVAKLCNIQPLQNVAVVQKVCNIAVPLLTQASGVASSIVGAPARVKRSFDFGAALASLTSGNGLLAQFKPQIDAITNIIQAVEQHQSPAQIIQAVLKLNIQDDVAKVCAIQTLQNFAPVQKACGVVVPLLNKAASVVSSIVPQQRYKRGFNFGGFVTDLFQNGPLSNLGDTVNRIKNLATTIKDHKSPQDIVNAVIGLGLQDKIGQVCNLQVLTNIAEVQKVCTTVVPLLQQGANLVQAAPALLSGGLASLG